jgi:hypothetical protein
VFCKINVFVCSLHRIFISWTFFTTTWKHISEEFHNHNSAVKWTTRFVILMKKSHSSTCLVRQLQLLHPSFQCLLYSTLPSHCLVMIVLTNFFSDDFLQPITKGAKEHTIQSLPTRKYKKGSDFKDTDQ